VARRVDHAAGWAKDRRYGFAIAAAINAALP
jgi:hypothetical protein